MTGNANDWKKNPYASPDSDLDQDINDPDLYPEGYTGQVVYGTFWERFVALFVDGIIQQILAYVLAFSFGMVYGIAVSDRELTQTDDAILNLGGGLIGLLTAWLYCSLQESSPAQATIGKKMMGLKVTDLNGQPISFGRSTGRHFAKILSIFFLIGYFVQPFNPRKQTWHDSLSGTVVVKK